MANAERRINWLCVIVINMKPVMINFISVIIGVGAFVGQIRQTILRLLIK